MFYFHDLTVGKFEKKKTKLYLLIKEFSASLCFSKKAETFISRGNSLGVETRNSNMFALSDLVIIYFESIICGTRRKDN